MGLWGRLATPPWGWRRPWGVFRPQCPGGNRGLMGVGHVQGSGPSALLCPARRGCGPFLGSPSHSLGLGPGSQQPERKKPPSWELALRGHLPMSPRTEGTGLQEAAACPLPLPKAGHL